MAIWKSSFGVTSAGRRILPDELWRLARALGILFKNSDQVGFEQDALRFFGEEVPLVPLSTTSRAHLDPSPEPFLTLRRVLSKLQNHLLEAAGDQLPDVELLAFFLKQGQYRSRHIAVRRAIYHVVPHEGHWKLKRQGQDEGETFALKDEAVKVGADRARAHAAGQLVVHAPGWYFSRSCGIRSPVPSWTGYVPYSRPI